MASKALAGEMRGRVYYTVTGKHVEIGDEPGFESELKRRVGDCAMRINETKKGAEDP
jgi:hypothetical protein